MPSEAKTNRKHAFVRTVAKWLVSATAVALLVRQLDVKGLGAALASARPLPIAGAAGIYLFGQAVTAWRWQVIARAVGFRETLGRVVAWYYVGMFFNLFGPSTLGGDVVRSLYLGAPTRRRAAALNTVVFDRLSGLSMLVLLALVAFVLFGTFGLPQPVVWTTLAVGIGLIGGWWVIPGVARRLLSADNRVRRLIDVELRPFWVDPKLLVSTSAISLFFHVVQVLAAMLVGSSLGLGVPWTYYFVFHPLVTIFSAIPISVAGIGVREAGYVWFLSSAGNASQERAAAFAVLWFGVLLASSLVGGLVFAADGARIPALRSSGDPARRTTGDGRMS
jgi:glycosyltransferase 2 family protein